MQQQSSINSILEEESKPGVVSVCKCICSETSSDKVEISSHKKRILGIVSQTENYLRKRRIPQLIRFLLAKILAQESDKPFLYLEKLLDDCMLFRAGVGVAPVLFEKGNDKPFKKPRHVEAMITSFDPGERGWLTPGQIRRLYATLGLTVNEQLHEIMSCETVLTKISEAQENELFDLISAGMNC